MARRLLLLALTAAIVAAVPTAAFAKGEMEAIQGQAVITGPGLPGPIELTGELSGFDTYLSDTGASEFGAFMRGTPLVSLDSGRGWFELKPANLAALGPRYTVRYRFEYENGTVSDIRHYLYPYAPEGPLQNIPAAEGINGRFVELWWRSSSDLMVRTLRAHGLPADPPPMVLPEPPAAQPLPAIGTDQTWIWATAAAGLLVLLVAGVIAGRRRRGLERA